MAYGKFAAIIRTNEDDTSTLQHQVELGAIHQSTYLGQALFARFRMLIRKIAIAAIALVVITVFATHSAKPVLRDIDLRFFHEELKDTLGRFTSHEDWQRATPLRKREDSRWLVEAKKANHLINVAHALGGSGSSAGNTLPAFAVAKAEGYRLFEVDISLDEQSRLRCHHGPEEPPAFDEASSCTFDRLLPMVDKADGWVVADIKTDFYQTAEKMLQVAREQGLSHRLIFQLYHSDQLAWFEKVSAATTLATPIVTVYDSKRSANHIMKVASALGIQVLTIPTEKLDSLQFVDPKLTLLTHPIHSCSDWEAIRPDVRIDGIYSSTAVDLRRCKARK
jgi:hypothetical protein